MKKRWISLALAALMCMSVAGVAACGDGGSDDKGGGTQQGDQGNQGNQGNQGEGSGNEGEGGSGNEGEGGSGNEGEGEGGEGGGQETPAEPDEQAPAYTDNGATLNLLGSVKKDDPDRAISSDLFGLFLEDINYASYALDDNLIANGSFESDAAGIWQTDGATLSRASGSGALTENSPYYAKLNVSAKGGSLINKGYAYVPMAIKRTAQYVFSAFIKGYGGDVTVSAKMGSTVLAESTFTVEESAEWVKYEQTLTPTAPGSEGVSVQISFANTDSEVCLDAVKFETTDSTIGIKNYMYEAIADLSPAFFRFPGGCVIEGKTIDSAYDWKNSIGAVAKNGDDTVPAFTYTLVKDGKKEQVTTYGEQATRKQNTDIWERSGTYYSMEYGIGFYEYFLLCDSLGAKAIPIVNCGLSCQTQSNGVALPGRHGNRINDYIQDAIDLIEFAKGDKSTEWGHVRELMGHPEPFEMDYIGIGNEQWGNYYTGYYEKFLKDENFKKALAQYNVKPIVGNCTMFEHCEDPTTGRKGAAQIAAEAALRAGDIAKIADYGVVDQHYYVNYTDFLANTTFYDNYIRPTDKKDGDKAYEVFVGEYSANSDAIRSPAANDSVKYAYTQNSWITAISEAAMMTGFERNGDVVKLAAYAPMFGVANTNNNPTTSGNNAANQWQVDMMYFTGDKIVLTPNYYVQQLFMQNSGDYKVNSRLNFADGVTMPQTTYKASAGTGAEATRTLDDIFYVVSADEETGDIIVKFVNAGDKAFKMNIDFGVSSLSLTGIADVTELQNDNPNVIHTLKNSKAVRPNSYTIGGFTDGKTIGYTLKPYSVSAIRLHTK